jgi:hypothetical protein
MPLGDSEIGAHGSFGNTPAVIEMTRAAKSQRKSPAGPSFKIGDEVIERAARFHIYAIAETLAPAASGERIYRITDQGLSQPILRVVRESEIVSLDNELNRLLNMAALENTQVTRSRLILALCEARSVQPRSQAIPAELLDEFVKEIDAVIRRLRILERDYDGLIGHRVHRPADSVINVVTMHLPHDREAAEMAAKFPALFHHGKHREEDRPALQHWYGVNIQELLLRWREDVSSRRLKRGGPKQNSKRAVAAIAEDYFYGNSGRRKKRGTQQQLKSFAKGFYETATGKELKKELSHYLSGRRGAPAKVRGKSLKSAPLHSG